MEVAEVALNSANVRRGFRRVLLVAMVFLLFLPGGDAVVSGC
jgi:hypothetical protein